MVGFPLFFRGFFFCFFLSHACFPIAVWGLVFFAVLGELDLSY